MLPEVDSKTLAALLGLTQISVNRLAADGVVPSKRQGRSRRFPLPEAVTAYCDYMRSPESRPGLRAHEPTDPLKAERIRQAREAADKLALQNAQARAELLDRGAVEREWSDMLRRVRQAMLAVPTRVAGRLGHLTAHDLSELDHEIRAALTDAAKEATDHAA